MTRALPLTLALIALSVAESPYSLAAESPANEPYVAPSPYDVLETRHLVTPPLDSVSFCLPQDLPTAYASLVELARQSKWRQATEILEPYLEQADRVPEQARILLASLKARAATKREQRVPLRAELSRVLQDGGPPGSLACGRLEMARLDLLLRRFPESAAQLRLAERQISRLSQPASYLEAVAFYEAERLYGTGYPFEAHLSFRRLAGATDARIAAGARLRLTDLSFEAGKSESVQIEYEALLPRAEAFGATMQGWALRAAEAALDAGDYSASAAFLERYMAEAKKRDSRDLVSIRRADLLVLTGHEREARDMLGAVASSRGRKEPGIVAAIRAIDLQLAPGTGEKRIETLLHAADSQRRGIRLYALGVLVHELVKEGDVDGGLAALTRLAYEGDDRVLTPHFRSDLAALLDRTVAQSTTNEECVRVIGRLGGRYTILMPRARDFRPFLRLGLCLEKLQMPWMAVTLYRRLTRAFGAEVAGESALPMARSALAAGDAPMVRAAATASLAGDHANRREWTLLLAEAELRDGKFERAVELLRELLTTSDGAERRVHIIALFASGMEGMEQIGVDPSSEDRALLVSRLLETPPEERRLDVLRFSEAAMIAAHMQYAMGEQEKGRELYSMVGEVLPDGPIRAEALYSAGSIALDGAESTERPPSEWRQAAAVGEAGPWGALARFDLGYLALRDAYLLGAKGETP